MIAKLLWNPYQDTDSLAQVFINAYYGKAASQVFQYYQLCQRQVTPDRHFSVKLDWKSPIFTDPFIVEGQSVLKKATAAVRSAAPKTRIPSTTEASAKLASGTTQYR